jgi:hypothetical protein
MMDDQKILIEGLEEAAICELDIGRSRLFECIAKIVKELVELRKANAELVTRIAKAELAFAIVEGRNAELKKENQALRAVLPKYITEDKNNPLLKKLLNCCDGLSTEYAQSNYGAANEWVRHIDVAYQNYQEGIDESEAKALKAGN